MFAPALDARRRYRPRPAFTVGLLDLAPISAGRFVGARARQDDELERRGLDFVVPAQPAHERGHVTIGQRREVLHALALLAARQQVVEMALPSRWVFAAAIAVHPRPIEHALDARTQAAGRFRDVPPRLF